MPSSIITKNLCYFSTGNRIFRVEFTIVTARNNLKIIKACDLFPVFRTW